MCAEIMYYWHSKHINRVKTPWQVILLYINLRIIKNGPLLFHWYFPWVCICTNSIQLQTHVRKLVNYARRLAKLMTFQAMCATAECSSISLGSEYPLSEASNKWQPQGANVLLVSLTKWEVPHWADFGKLSHSSDEAKAGWKKNSVDNSGQEQEGFLFSETYRPLWGPTYPIIKWVPRVSSQGVKFATDLHVLPRVRMGGTKPLLTTHSVTACRQTTSPIPWLVFSLPGHISM